MSVFAYEVAKRLLSEEKSVRDNAIASSEGMMMYAQAFDAKKASQLPLSEYLFMMSTIKDALASPFNGETDYFNRFEMPLRTFSAKMRNLTLTKRRTPEGSKLVTLSLPREMLPMWAELGKSRWVQEMILKEWKRLHPEDACVQFKEPYKMKVNDEVLVGVNLEDRQPSEVGIYPILWVSAKGVKSRRKSYWTGSGFVLGDGTTIGVENNGENGVRILKWYDAKLDESES